ncbi:HAD family hydrolase [Pedobacter yulinensis]|uniref:D,D-heptose 1,7-bisphosphate phosphatase n=1 Tax=Pedobacter yulinensis TaxID=2126353 RepID=A0A2T3HK64_9SPHI|nr:HAD family hydrolase [Pedobacter yulinensis]PST82803.1 HAD family hydrolase [Pedobacter yulinensis]
MEVKAAIFLDKDGTLVNDVPYNVDPAKITLADHIIKGLKLLAASGFRLFVVSNQSGVARGYFRPEALNGVESCLSGLLSAQGVRLEGFYFCPHHPDGSVRGYNVDCGCRKPMPGMLLCAAREHGIDLSRSWMIGDILNDVEAGHRAGCRSVLIDNGNETEWLPGPYRSPEISAASIDEAAIKIVEQMKSANEKSERIPA